MGGSGNAACRSNCVAWPWGICVWAGVILIPIRWHNDLNTWKKHKRAT